MEKQPRFQDLFVDEDSGDPGNEVEWKKWQVRLLANTSLILTLNHHS